MVGLRPPLDPDTVRRRFENVPGGGITRGDSTLGLVPDPEAVANPAAGRSLNLQTPQPIVQQPQDTSRSSQDRKDLALSQLIDVGTALFSRTGTNISASTLADQKSRRREALERLQTGITLLDKVGGSAGLRGATFSESGEITGTVCDEYVKTISEVAPGLESLAKAQCKAGIDRIGALGEAAQDSPTLQTCLVLDAGGCVNRMSEEEFSAKVFDEISVNRDQDLFPTVRQKVPRIIADLEKRGQLTRNPDGTINEQSFFDEMDLAAQSGDPNVNLVLDGQEKKAARRLFATGENIGNIISSAGVKTRAEGRESGKFIHFIDKNGKVRSVVPGSEEEVRAREEQLTPFTTQGVALRKTTSEGKKSQIGLVDPSKVTPESLQIFAETNDFSKLVPVDEGEEGTKRTDIDRLAQQFQGLSDDFVKAQDAMLRVEEAYAQGSAPDATREDLNTADTALIFGFFGTIEPSGIVRGNEFEQIASSPNVPDRIKAFAVTVRKGGVLSQATRDSILEQTRRIFTPRLGAQVRLEDQFSQKARGLPTDPFNVVLRFINPRFRGDAELIRTGSPAAAVSRSISTETRPATPDDIERIRLKLGPDATPVQVVDAVEAEGLEFR